MADMDSGSEDEDATDAKEKKPDGVRTKYDRMVERKNQDVFADHYAKMVDDEDVDQLDGAQSLDDDLFTVKQRIPAQTVDTLDDDSADGEEAVLAPGAKVVHIPGAKDGIILDSKRREKLLKSKKKLLSLKGKGTKLVFDDEGNAHPLYEMGDEDEFKDAGAAEEQRKRFLEEEAAKVREADLEDLSLIHI